MAAGRFVVCMDGDLQHPPEKVPEFLKVLASPFVTKVQAFSVCIIIFVIFGEHSFTKLDILASIAARCRELVAQGVRAVMLCP